MSKPVLLDTQAFLYLRMGHPDLPESVRRLFQDPGQPVFLSLVSVWEMAIKVSLGKLDVRGRLRDLVESIDRLGVSSLPIQRDHVLGVEKLPFHHRDPFDRLLVSQAKAERMPIVSNDAIFDSYGLTRIWSA